MSKKVKIISGSVIAALALSAGAVFAFANPFAAPAAPPAATVTVTKGEVSATVSAKGAIAAASTSNASFAKGGTITGIAVTVGQSVAVGQDLASIDPADADRDLEKARGALGAAEESLNNSRTSYNTTNNALADARAALSALPADSPDRAAATAAVREQEGSLPGRDTDIVNAERARDDANRDLATAQAARDQTVLKAPIGGVITAINGTVGSVASGGGSSTDAASGTEARTATAASGLITISDISTLRVSAAIPEANIAQIAVQQAATVTLAGPSAATPIAGTVTSIAPTAQTTDGVVSYAVTIQLVDPPATVKLGQTGFVSITTAAVTGVMTLPSEAITLTAPGEGTVTLVPSRASGKAKSATVKTGLSGNGLTEITEGVSAGDVVQIAMPAGSATTGTDPMMMVGP